LKTLVAGNLFYSLIPLSVLLLGERSRFWQYVPHIYVSQERAGFSNVDVQVFVLLILIQFLVFSGRRLRVRTFIIAICGLVLITIDILYSQFRSIWLVSVLGVVVLWNSQLLVNRKYRKRGSLQRIPRTIIFGVIIFVSFVVTIGVFEVVGRYNLSTIGERLATLQNVQATMSYRNRLADSQLVLEEAAKRNLLLGSGLGVTWNYLSTYGIIGFVDNTFATMFAKIGLIGLAFFLMLFFVFFREIYLLMKSRWFFDDDLKSIVAIEISVLTTLFLLPFFSAHLFNQRPVITCFAVFLGGVSALRRHVSEIT